MNSRTFVVKMIKKIVNVTTVLLFLLMHPDTTISQNVNASLYRYYIYNTKSIRTGFFFCSYSTRLDTVFEENTVEISINDPWGNAARGVSCYFVSYDNDTISKFSDSNGMIHIGLNSLSSHPRIYVSAYTANNTYGHKMRCNSTNINLHRFVTTDYEINIQYILDKITINLSEITLENAYYVIDSQIPLSNNDIECIRLDIIMEADNCTLWDKIKVRAAVDI